MNKKRENNIKHTKRWRDNNKDKVKEYNKIYRETNKEKLKKYTKYNCINKVNNNKVRRISEFYKFNQIVSTKNGMILSDLIDYRTAHTKISILCLNKHEFSISKNNLIQGKWCPQCSCYKSEYYTKYILEHMFNDKFIKIRPNWLKNKDGNNLELDMYNEKYNLAVEYNGAQHYKHNSYFQKSIEDFNKLVEHDNIKKETLKKLKINFIVVPYTISNIFEFLKLKLQHLNIKCVNLNEPIISYELFYNDELMNKFINIVNDKNGIILYCNSYMGDSTVKIKCEIGHEWNTSLKQIIKGSWCHECGRKVSEETKEKLSLITKERISNGTLKPPIKTKKERIELTEKVCVNCQKILPIDNFLKKKASIDNHQSWCKLCTSNYRKLDRETKKNLDTKFSCDNCNKIYKLKDSLTRHIKEKHS